MAYQLSLGGLVTLLTVLIHAGGLSVLARVLAAVGPTARRVFAKRWHMALTIGAVSAVFGIHTVEIWVWAVVYLGLDVLPDLETSLYFSMVTFTTLGYGDITLPTTWRLLGAAQGAGGFILFGWSTAFIFEVMTRTWRGRFEDGQ